MVLQWLAIAVLTPFVLLPLFPTKGVDFTVRLLIVIGAWIGSGVMTIIYLRARKVSHRYAAAGGQHHRDPRRTTGLHLDAGLATYLPDLFWIFPVLVIVIANRFGYKEALMTGGGLSALYAVTIVARLNAGQPARLVVGQTLLWIALLMLIAVATSFISQRERRESRDARILSRLAASMGSTLEADELMDKVVQGISEASGLGRCSAFMASSDGKWALPQSTTETDRPSASVSSRPGLTSRRPTSPAGRCRRKRPSSSTTRSPRR